MQLRLHLVGRGCVVLEAVIAFNGDLAGFQVQDYVAEAPTIILVAVGNQSLKMFLHMRPSHSNVVAVFCCKPDGTCVGCTDGLVKLLSEYPVSQKDASR